LSAVAENVIGLNIVKVVTNFLARVLFEKPIVAEIAKKIRSFNETPPFPIPS
jgi:hypothetical protein